VKKNGIYNHVLRYTGLFGGVQGLCMLMSLVRNKFAAIFIGSIGLGLIDIFNRTLSLFSAISSLIAPVSSVRSLSIVYERGDERQLAHQVKVVRSWTLLTGVVGLILCLVLSPLVSRWTFSNYGYTLDFILLSPIIPLSAITSTELAILQATRQLRKAALAASWGAVILMLIAVPFYVILGRQGIVPALVLSTLGCLIVYLRYTLPLFPWHIQPFSLTILRQGLPLLRLSIAYVLAGIAASSAELLVRNSIIRIGNVADVGLYSSGLILTVAAAKFLFVAMDADYYPRLSSLSHRPLRMNLTVNRQLEVCVLLIAPFLICFDVMMPVIIRLLFTPKFLSVVPMAILASYYMFFKATNVPIDYIALSRGEGRMYFLMETSYWVYFALFVILGYQIGGLEGAGVGLSISNFVELIIVYTVYHRYYGLQIGRQASRIIAVQFTLLTLGVLVSMSLNGFAKYAVGVPLFVISLGYTVRLLCRNSNLATILSRKN